MSVTTLIDEHMLTTDLQSHVTWGKATVTAECDTVNVGDFVLNNDRAGSPVSPRQCILYYMCSTIDGGRDPTELTAPATTYGS